MKKVLTVAASAAICTGIGYGINYRVWHPAPPKVELGKKHIACIGDSITYGAGVHRKSARWEYFLQQELGTHYQVLNYGLSGRTLQDEGDWPYRKEPFFRITQELAADIYIIMLGTNDSKPQNWDADRFAKQYREFVGVYQHLENHPEIFIMVPPMCYPQKSGKIVYDISERVISEEIRPFLHQFTQDNSIQSIDLHSFTKDHSEWFTDGVHPNQVGNRHISGFVFENLFVSGTVDL
jgi:lysophospholipase L1-like esterase